MADKYMSDIHLEDYTGEYENPKALRQDLIADCGREKISLDGVWHYAVDRPVRYLPEAEMVPGKIHRRPGIYAAGGLFL